MIRAARERSACHLRLPATKNAPRGSYDDPLTMSRRRAPDAGADVGSDRDG